MIKWADYCISQKRMNLAGTHIDKVKVHADNGDTIGAGAEWPRNQVVNTIKSGSTFVTVDFRDGKYHRGEDVRVVLVNGAEYIRTDANAKAADNLGILPDF